MLVTKLMAFADTPYIPGIGLGQHKKTLSGREAELGGEPPFHGEDAAST